MRSDPAGLDEGRAVQLLIVRDAKVVRVGSGYLVTDGLVLTAAHVVVGDDMVIVRQVVGRRRTREFAGVVVWSDAGADIAVVRLDGSAGDEAAAGLPPLRYGRVDGHVACEALGFPRFKLRQDAPAAGVTLQDWYRDTHQAIGTIAPLSNLRQGTLEITVPPPEYDATPPHSPWEGMSGAAVFAGGALVGVINEHHRSDGLGRLAARPVVQWYDVPTKQMTDLRTLLGLPEQDQLETVSEPPGDVNLSAGAPVRTRYLQQVLRVAPSELRDRQDELGALERFCTDPATAGRYWWWRAKAWSGKSALLSWFVLHPPAGVRIASFFITSQLAGQDSRGAFMDNLLEQLVALLDQRLPPFLVEATREAHLMGLMAEAASLCRDRGEHFVLVIDGLDKDRGVQIGTKWHSIAGLLPATLPTGMRVIVASRADVPLPSDVALVHPLRDPDIQHVLEPSRHASAARTAEVYRDLASLTREQNDFSRVEGPRLNELELNLTSNEPQIVAYAYHELGSMAYEQEKLDLAEKYYQRTLEVRLEAGDWHRAGSTCGLLGLVAEAQGRLHHAEEFYRRALELFIETGDRTNIAIAYAQLAGVQNKQGRFSLAEDNYRQAIKNFHGTGEQLTANNVASMLGILLEKTGRIEEAFTQLAKTAGERRRLTGNLDATHIKLLSDLYRRLDKRTAHNAMSALDRATRRELARRLKQASDGR
jgi:tetratricopeptide (TPR) repeat protein